MGHKENILIVAPHPDDAFISCGGFILQTGAKYNFTVACMTSIHSFPDSSVRMGEERAALQKLEELSHTEIELLFFPGKDKWLYKEYQEMVAFLEERLAKKDYKFIFCPHPEDTHQDHRSVSEAVLSACRYECNIIFNETPSSIKFHPSMFVEVSEDNVEIKKRISKYYASQVLGAAKNHKFSLSDFIEAKLISHGAKSRTCKYAEGYKPYRYYLPTI